jgi:hypothetical protein
MKKSNLTITVKVIEYSIIIENDVIIKAGLLKGDSLIGNIWSQHFIKINC